MKLSPSVREIELAPDFTVYEIDHLTCQARVAELGAQVLSWKPRDEAEVLYLSEDAFYKDGSGIRGGVPICWPWFGPHPTEDDAPQHGLVRKKRWSLISCEEDETSVSLRFEITEGIWSAELTAKFGNELEITLESLNRNEIPIVISGALHTYFAISDIEQVRIVNLEGAEYFDKVTQKASQKHKGAVVFSGELDRVYESSSDVLLVDDVSGRTILIEKKGSPSTVVWNPWDEKAAALRDMPDKDFLKFCCVETAIANDRAEIVMPGGSHILMTRISIEE